jgi:chorismate mutase
MDLEEIRKSIDGIDYEIVKLLNRRLECALRVRRLKSGVVEPAREKEVFEHVRSYSHNVTEPEFTERLYTTIIGESRRIQEIARSQRMPGLRPLLLYLASHSMMCSGKWRRGSSISALCPWKTLWRERSPR